MVTFSPHRLRQSDSEQSLLSMEDTNMAGQQSAVPPTPNNDQLMTEILRLRERLGNAQANTPIVKRPRPVLPDPELFDGSLRTQYPQFRAKLLAKLSSDSHALGGASQCLWYGFSRLSGSAATQFLPWMSIHATEGRVNDGTVSQVL